GNLWPALRACDDRRDCRGFADSCVSLLFITETSTTWRRPMRRAHCSRYRCVVLADQPIVTHTLFVAANPLATQSQPTAPKRRLETRRLLAAAALRINAASCSALVLR